RARRRRRHSAERSPRPNDHGGHAEQLARLLRGERLVAGSRRGRRGRQTGSRRRWGRQWSPLERLGRRRRVRGMRRRGRPARTRRGLLDRFALVPVEHHARELRSDAEGSRQRRRRWKRRTGRGGGRWRFSGRCLRVRRRRRRCWRGRQRRTRRARRFVAGGRLCGHRTDDQRRRGFPSGELRGHHVGRCGRGRCKRLEGSCSGRQHRNVRRRRHSWTEWPRGRRRGSAMTARVLVVVILAWVWTTSALAAESTADALLDQGAGLFRRKEYEGAREAFAHAYELEPKAATLFNLALSELNSDHPVEAVAHLREYLTHADEPPAKLESVRTKWLPRAEACTARLDVFAPAGAQLLVDGVVQEHAT